MLWGRDPERAALRWSRSPAALVWQAVMDLAAENFAALPDDLTDYCADRPLPVRLLRPVGGLWPLH